MVKRLASCRWLEDNLLHIETELGIINIRLGLTNTEGRKVESIEVLADADRFAGETPAYIEGTEKAMTFRIIQVPSVSLN